MLQFDATNMLCFGTPPRVFVYFHRFSLQGHFPALKLRAKSPIYRHLSPHRDASRVNFRPLIFPCADFLLIIIAYFFVAFSTLLMSRLMICECAAIQTPESTPTDTQFQPFHGYIRRSMRRAAWDKRIFDATSTFDRHLP